jgi:hypothetical protein
LHFISLHMNYEGRYIYYYMQFVLHMKISIVLLFIHTLICLNCYLINCDLNNLLKQFAC